MDTPQENKPTHPYHVWRTAQFTALGTTLHYATKQGLHASGRPDAPVNLLTRHIDLSGVGRLIDLNCGSGLVGAFAALRCPSAMCDLVDRNYVAAEAARRTTELNKLANATVHFGNGTSTLPGTVSADVATIRLPKGKLPTLQLIWDAFHILRLGGRCYLAGANDEGIKSSMSRMLELFGNATVLGYESGCRVGVATKSTDTPVNSTSFKPDDMRHDVFHRFTISVRDIDLTICSRPGVFAWDRLDAGTRILIDNMEVSPDSSVLDLGCGNGIIGMVAAKQAMKGHVHLVDVDSEAVRSATESARVNAISNCSILPGDAASSISPQTFDLIATNPPFHITHRADLSMASEFIQAAAAMLKPNGRLLLVANITLPYERLLKKHFGTSECIHSDRHYKLFKCQAPHDSLSP